MMLSPRNPETGNSVNSSSPSCSANAPYWRSISDQFCDAAVAHGLRSEPLTDIDQQDREIRGRGAGDHVPRVLLVARRVGDDVLARVGREEAVRDVDRDALLALRLEPGREQR